MKGMKIYNRRRRRIGGLVLLTFGMGMALGLMLNAWAFVAASLIIVAGFWMVFL
ncbi:MAG: hypothetical protein FWD98_09095 [Defluviitaleaceae bacterium]|nr:hypothetical protein [Defluviitaleaceae bacterium]